MESLKLFILSILVIGAFCQTTEFPEDPDTSTTEEEPEFECTADGFFPHPRYCEHYYECRNLEPQLLKCPGTFLFDLKYFGCNFAENTDCQNRERPDGYPGTVTPPDGSSTRTPPPGFDCPVQDGNYPDPTDCTAYFQCAAGIPYYFKCPFPLRFDIERQVCNHPGSVNCGDRPLPPP